MSDFIPPQALGLPDKFSSWRPNQDKAIQRIVNSDKRVILSVLGTGSGKSLAAIASSILFGGKTVILTSTKGLQTQYMNDFASMGMVDMRGRNSYPCLATKGENSCDEGPCMAGVFCPLKAGGCYYYDQLKKAQKSNLVVTNYAYWLFSNAYSEGLGKVNLLVCDEGHDSPEAVASFMQVDFARTDSWLAPLLPTIPEKLSIKAWKDWVRITTENLNTEIDYHLAQVAAGSNKSARVVAKMKKIKKNFDIISTMDEDNWIVDVNPHTVTFAPIWASEYAQNILFMQIPHILLTSASICMKTAEMMGLSDDDCEHFEYPHTFPVENRLLMHLPTARFNFRSSQQDLYRMVTRIDQIIKERLDRKGIVHSVSYARRDLVLANSKFMDIMMTHDSVNTESIVKMFKESDPPKVLVSPSVATGYDFPGDECEYQIITKVPWPDSRSKIMKARTESDREYAPYITMQQLVQACGRSVRTPTDISENFIIDDNILWFIKQYKKFAPKYFLEAFEKKIVAPPPPQK